MTFDTLNLHFLSKFKIGDARQLERKYLVICSPVTFNYNSILNENCSTYIFYQFIFKHTMSFRGLKVT